MTDHHDRRALRYTTLAATIHWASAALIATQLWLGFTFEDFAKGTPERALYFDWHKTIGVLILLLALGRLVVRWKNPPPPYPETTPAWQRKGATAVHRALYAFMILLPLTGLMAVSRGGATTGLVGGLRFPTVPDIGGLHESHEALVWGLIVLLGLHVAAALHALLVERGAMAGRMPPFGAR